MVGHKHDIERRAFPTVLTEMITFNIQRAALLSIERLSFVTFVFDVVVDRGRTSTLVSDTEVTWPNQAFCHTQQALFT